MRQRWPDRLNIIWNGTIGTIPADDHKETSYNFTFLSPESD